MAVNKLSLKFCTLLHNSISYDVAVALADLTELDAVLQEWALANIAPVGTVTFDLPQDLLDVSDATDVVTTLATDGFVYLNPPVSEYMSIARSAGIAGGVLPTFPTSLASTLYVMPGIDVFLYSEPLFQGYFGQYSVPAASMAVVAGINYLGVTFNAGAPIFQMYSDWSSFNMSNIIPIATVLYYGTSIYTIPFGVTGSGAPEQLAKTLWDYNRFTIEKAYTLAMDTSLYTQLGEITVSAGLSEIVCPPVNTANVNNDMILFYLDSSSVWQNLKVDTLNNAQYQGAGLQSLAPGEYVINNVYRLVNGACLMFNVLSGKFATLQAAVDSAALDNSELPPTIADSAVLVGRVIVAASATTATIQRVQRVAFGI